MATRAKDTAPTGKEKRGSSPSPIIHHGRTTNTTSKTTSPVKKQADPTSTLNKNVPSYLKPTIAQAKKSASSSELHNIHNNKTSLTRRSSFDNKPPLPSSSSPKTRISPNPRERIPRSSSLSAKTSTSQKPLLDRLSKTSKDGTGKQRTTGLNSRPVTKKKMTATTTTTTTTRKQDITNVSTTKASVTTNSPDIAESVISDRDETHSEPEDHQELTVQETEKEMIVSDGEMAAVSDAGDNDSAMDDDHEEPDANVNNGGPEDIKAAADQSSIVEESQEIRIEEPEETLLVKEPEEISNIEPNEHDSSEKEKEQIVLHEPEENQEPKEDNEGVNQEKEIAIVEETKAEPEKNMKVESAKPQNQVAHGKNKESVVSNDVIEETATKLREQRKNRVKALAGAFETVISLQDK